MKTTRPRHERFTVEPTCRLDEATDDAWTKALRAGRLARARTRSRVRTRGRARTTLLRTRRWRRRFGGRPQRPGTNGTGACAKSRRIISPSPRPGDEPVYYVGVRVVRRGRDRTGKAVGGDRASGGGGRRPAGARYISYAHTGARVQPWFIAERHFPDVCRHFHRREGSRAEEAHARSRMCVTRPPRVWAIHNK